MDERRLSTGDVIAAGILGVPRPTTEIPRDRETYEVGVDELDREVLEARLLANDVLVCSEYYGVPHLWKQGQRYHGCLLQYRSVTERPTFAEAAEALDWFIETAISVAG
jgi:hypothetical protein